MRRIKVFLFIIINFFTIHHANSQLTASGRILFHEDFGGNAVSDSDVKPEGIPQVIGYTYHYPPTGAGYYSISKEGCHHSPWRRMDDHTYLNDLSRGYLMQVDGSDALNGQFYEQQIDDLCFNVVLIFSFWVANIAPGYTEPNLTISITDLNDSILHQYETGIIPADPLTDITTWREYETAFTIPESVHTVIFRIKNNCMASMGNDFTLDDIMIRLNVPPAAVLLPEDSICVGDNITLTGDFENDSTFVEPIGFQWLYSLNNDPDISTWQIVGDEQNLYIPSIQLSNTGFYRLAAANINNVGFDNCRSMSDPVYLTVLECVSCPMNICNDTSICKNSSTQLWATGADFYQWYPADGLSDSTISNPIATPTETTTYTVKGYTNMNNLVYNGDFELGDEGFSSDYTHNNDLIPEGMYAVGTDASLYHPGFTGLDHTTGYGNFMMINGASGLNMNVWSQNITVVPNSNYLFSTWVCSIAAGGSSGVAQLQFCIDGNQLGDIFTAPLNTNQWQEFTQIWNSGSSEEITISILNQNVGNSGNDFGLDDIRFTGLCMNEDSVNVTVNENITWDTTVTICPGETFTELGFNVSEEGVYTQIIHNMNHCDSIITLNLLVATPFTISGGGMFCSNEEGLLIDIDGSEQQLYHIYCNGTFVQSVMGTGNPMSFGPFTQTGTYTVECISSATCSLMMQGEVYIKSIPFPPPRVIRPE